MGMFLQRKQINAFGRLAKLVDSGDTQLLACCNELEGATAVHEFPYIYAADLLANRRRLLEAISFLERCESNTFASKLCQYLKECGVFAPRAVTFADSRPYDIYTRTGLYKEYLAGAKAAIMAFVDKNPQPVSSSRFSILDIGTGNGVFITEIINCIAAKNGACRCKLIVLDQSQAMHAAAEEYIKLHAKLDVETVHIYSKIQDIAPELLPALLGEEPIWFINAGLSVHHMPDTVKINMLKNLSVVAEHFLLTDMSGNHDLPEKDSPELVYSIVCTYDRYFKAVVGADLTEADKQLCIYDFWLAEALTMLSCERPQRIDYHATIKQWGEYAGKAGYEVVNLIPTTYCGDDPLNFTMHLRVKE